MKKENLLISLFGTGKPININPKAAVLSPDEKKILPMLNRHWSEDGIAFISVKGPLVNQVFGLWCQSYSGLQATIESYNQPDVKGIILVIDSPGGDSFGNEDIANFIRAFPKPIVAYVEGMAASAAYWIAAAANRVVGHPSSFHGSVGSCMLDVKFSDTEKITLVSDQSPLKNPDAFTKEGAAIIKNTLTKIAGQFILAISKLRNVSEADILKNFGRGDIVDANQALKAGMIDAIGNKEKAIEILGSLITPEQEPTSNKSNKRNKRKMGKRKSSNKVNTINNVAVLIEDVDVPEDVDFVEVTKETLEVQFPELIEEIREEARASMDEETAEVVEATALADDDSEEERSLVKQLTSKEITVSQFTKQLLVIKNKNKNQVDPKPENHFESRALDNPEIAAAGNSGGDSPPKNSDATINAIKNARKSKVKVK